MAEPKKETVRIALPPRPETAAPTSNEKKGETVRIVLPSRTPSTPIRRLPPKIAPLSSSTEAAPEPPKVLPRRPPAVTPNTSPLLQPLPKPPGGQITDSGEPTPPLQPVRQDSNGGGPSVNRGPKKETARISVLPRPTPAGSAPVNMTKTQPLLVTPTASTPIAPVVITSRPVIPVETISRPLCWTLLAVSAVIFLIQIWNYVVS